LDAPRDRPFWVRRLKGSKDSIHTLEPDSVRALKRASTSFPKMESYQVVRSSM
jgi:hypothetical protein